MISEVEPGGQATIDPRENRVFYPKVISISKIYINCFLGIISQRLVLLVNYVLRLQHRQESD